MKLSILFQKTHRNLKNFDISNIIVKIGEELEKILPIELIEIIVWYVELDTKDEYFWAIAEWKIIDSIEIYNGNDLIALGLIFKIAGFGTEEFWELFKERLEIKINTANESFIEMAKLWFDS